jgi:hypothetical protein
MTKQTIYWGVVCRKCSGAIAFGSPTHHQFELGTAYDRPGAVRCAQGHNAIYFPRDFKFFSSDEEISDDAMRGNREAHRANNPVPVSPSDQQLRNALGSPDRTAARDSRSAKGREPEPRK